MSDLAESAPHGVKAPSPAQETTLRTSVMLWTLGTGLGFGQRLEKVAEAGYQAVELVGEYATWSAQRDEFLVDISLYV